MMDADEAESSPITSLLEPKVAMMTSHSTKTLLGKAQMVNRHRAPQASNNKSCDSPIKEPRAHPFRDFAKIPPR